MSLQDWCLVVAIAVSLGIASAPLWWPFDKEVPK